MLYNKTKQTEFGPKRTKALCQTLTAQRRHQSQKHTEQQRRLSHAASPSSARRLSSMSTSTSGHTRRPAGARAEWQTNYLHDQPPRTRADARTAAAPPTSSTAEASGRSLFRQKDSWTLSVTHRVLFANVKYRKIARVQIKRLRQD